MNAEPVVYLDASALVKLVVREPESSALHRYLRATSARVSSALARVEVLRAVRAEGSAAIARARTLLDRTTLLAIDDGVLDAAAEIDGPNLRSLDAIHLASAQAFGPSVTLVTYDARMYAAAERLGVSLAVPR